MSKNDINQEDIDLFESTVNNFPPPQDETRQEQLYYSGFTADFTVNHWHTGHDKVEFSATGHLIKRLKRHKNKVDKTMDMHGMTVAEAAHQLDHFLAQTQSPTREKFILLIHGKGQQSDPNRPKLKNATIHWLKTDDRVTAFCSASEQDGGSGALYLLLKRKQKEDEK